MTTGPRAGAAAGPPDDAAELRQQIRQAREQLGETVEELAAKTDVKARARRKATELAGRVKGGAGRALARDVPSLAAAGGALVMALLAAWLWRKR